jgi:hypothetical protein
LLVETALDQVQQQHFTAMTSLAKRTKVPAHVVYYTLALGRYLEGTTEDIASFQIRPLWPITTLFKRKRDGRKL